MPYKQTENSLILMDGRQLGYAEYGSKSGVPIFYFHGGQESRLSAGFMTETAYELGVRIIAPERPGIGLSTYQSGRNFLHWSQDICELADTLNLDRFSVFGLSGGAPHVLACLFASPERILNAAIVSGAAPYNYKGSLKGMWPPVVVLHWIALLKSNRLLKYLIKKDRNELLKSPKKRIAQFQNYLPLPDRIIMKTRPEYALEFVKGSLEAYVQGVEGVVQEWRMYVREWGFDLSKIEKEVTLWFGTEDRMAPIFRGQYYQNTLQNPKLRILGNEAHFSLIRTHLKEILSDLL